MENETLVGEPRIDMGYKKNPEVKTGGGSATPGRYFLTYGQVTAEFDQGVKDGVSKAGNIYSRPANVKAYPNFTIATSEDGSDEHAGDELDKYYQLTTLPARVYDHKLKAKVEGNFTTLEAAISMMGLSFPENGDVKTIIALAETLSGLNTPEAIYLTISGTVPKEWSAFAYKKFFKQADGKGFNLDEKAFRRDREHKDLRLADYKANGGTWAGVGYIVNYETDPTWTLDRPAVNTPHLTVFARLAPTDDAWKPK